MAQIERIPSFHDAHLVGVSWGDENLTLVFDLPDIGRSEVELTGVSALRIDGLREGNIVSCATLFDRGSCSSGELRGWLEYLVAGDFAPSTVDVAAAYEKGVSKILSAIECGNAQCFCLKPAYGGAVVCVHRAMQIQQGAVGKA